MPPIETQASLIAMAKLGNREALEKLLLSHAAMLSHHISRRFLPSLKNVSPDDILQETLLQAFLGIERIKHTSPDSFAAWLKSIADMQLLDALKSERRQKRGGHFRRIRATAESQTSWLVDLVEQLPADALTASRQLARREAIFAVQVGLAGLPSDQHQAIRLHLLEGKTLEETAVAMQRTTNSIRSLIHRGKKNLADALGRASLWMSSR